MRIIEIALILAVLGSINSIKVLKCYFYISDVFTAYNLKALDDKIPPPMNHEFNGQKGNFYVNLCNTVQIPPECAKQTDLEPSTVIFKGEDNKCISLLPSASSEIVTDVLNAKDPKKGIVITSTDQKIKKKFKV